MEPLPFLLTVFLVNGNIITERFIGSYAERETCEVAGNEYVLTANQRFLSELTFEARTFYICSGVISAEVPQNEWPNQPY